MLNVNTHRVSARIMARRVPVPLLKGTLRAIIHAIRLDQIKTFEKKRFFYKFRKNTKTKNDIYKILNKRLLSIYTEYYGTDICRYSAVLRPNTIYFRLRRMNCELYFFALRVNCPKAGRPQGVTGRLRPIGAFPSPPPCG